jgi:chemotaxis protein methyltransferase CheR
VTGGQLVLGAVEASQIEFRGFTPVPARGIALYQKNSDANGAGRESSSADRRPPAGAPPADGTQRAPVQVRPPSIRTRHSRAPVRPPESAVPRAESLYAAGRYQEARTLLLAEADRSDDTRLPSARLLAQCHANLGELAEALVCCERALAAARTDLALHFLRANILRELQRDEEALIALRNVLFLDPGHVLAHFTSANLHRRCHRKAAAAKHLAQVRRLLAGRDESTELPQSGGLTVGQLNAILAATPAPTASAGPATHD